MVALTGRTRRTTRDYRGDAAGVRLRGEVRLPVSRGSATRWQKKRRGTPALDLRAGAFVTYLQNHDQVANSARGERLHSSRSPGRLRALTALLLLVPGTPMLFQGQEFAASAPFLYFADHEPELARRRCADGRAEFLAQFPSARADERTAGLADPPTRATHSSAASSTSTSGRRMRRPTRCIAICCACDARFRRSPPQQRAAWSTEPCWRADAFALRYLLGRRRRSAADCEPRRGSWTRVHGRTADCAPARLRLGDRVVERGADLRGRGTPDLWAEDGWCLPGETAIVLRAVSARDRTRQKVARRSA